MTMCPVPMESTLLVFLFPYTEYPWLFISLACKHKNLYLKYFNLVDTHKMLKELFRLFKNFDSKTGLYI